MVIKIYKLLRKKGWGEYNFLTFLFYTLIGRLNYYYVFKDKSFISLILFENNHFTEVQYKTVKCVFFLISDYFREHETQLIQWLNTIETNYRLKGYGSIQFLLQSPIDESYAISLLKDNNYIKRYGYVRFSLTRKYKFTDYYVKYL